MKKGSKQRGRHGRNNSNGFNKNNINSCFDSNGPGGRIRGTIQQIIDKYVSMARDANSQNDRVLAENCYQYVEHYSRIVNSFPKENKRREEKKSFDKIENPETAKKEETETKKSYKKDNIEKEIVLEASNEVISETEEQTKKEVKKPRKKRVTKTKEKTIPDDMITDIGFLSKQLPLTTSAAE